MVQHKHIKFNGDEMMIKRFSYRQPSMYEAVATGTAAGTKRYQLDRALKNNR